MAKSAYRIFLSAVTRELASYREEVARVLRRKELEVRDQEHFRQGPATLLEQLRDYIEQCDAVILLVGERCGAFPTEEHVAALGPVPVYESYRAAMGQVRASYTQWEDLMGTAGADTLTGYVPKWTRSTGCICRRWTVWRRMRAICRRRWARPSPEPIPESILEVPIPGLSEAEASLDPRDALVELATYSLVAHATETPTFSVHRLVQDVTRRSLRNDSGHRPLTEALGWVNAAFVGEPQDVRTWPTLDPLALHVRVVCSFADAAEITEPTTRLMNQLGRLFLNKALLADAEPLMRRALAIDEKSFGLEHPNVIRDLHNLAWLLKETNRLDEAEPLMVRVVAILEKNLGEHHSKVATALNNLAQLLKATNRLDEAEPLMRRVLAIGEKSFGTEPPEVATALNNLAQLLQATNRLGEAEPLMRRALAIDEKSFGTEHPNVARDLNNLARLLQDTNRLDEAEPLMRRHLVIFIDFTRRTGHEHPQLKAGIGNYRLLLQKMGKSDTEIEAAFAALVSGE